MSSRKDPKISYDKLDIHSNNNSYRSNGKPQKNNIVEMVSKDNTMNNIDKKDITQDIIESKFCLECMIDIPLRAKHCFTCNKCVSTFDHHCFWVGNCIGERNKRIFLIFLIVHTINIALAIILV
jgi:hypothetical protein